MYVHGIDPDHGLLGCFVVFDLGCDPPMPMFTLHTIDHDRAHKIALGLVGMMAALHIGKESTAALLKLAAHEGMDAAGMELLPSAPRFGLAALDSKCGCRVRDRFSSIVPVLQ